MCLAVTLIELLVSEWHKAPGFAYIRLCISPLDGLLFVPCSLEKVKKLSLNHYLSL